MIGSPDLRKLVLILLSGFIAINASSQGTYIPGYIIDLKGDTIQGLIDNAGEVESTGICHFKTSKDSEPVDYLPGAISAYRYTGSKYYESKSVNFDDRVFLVFAECLVKGSASLYYVRNEEFELYFIETENSPFVALTNEKKEVIIDGSKTTVRTNNYIRMLKATFSDCYEIQSSIDKVKLSHNSLKSITCKYNDCAGKDTACITYDKGSRIKFRIGPLVGFSMNKLMLKGSEPYGSFEFDNSNGPVFGLVMDLSSSRLGEHLSFQLGTDIGKSEFNTTYEENSPIYPSTEYQYNVYMQGTSMKIYAGAKYNFGKSRVKPNLGGGLMFNKFIQSDSWYEVETYVSNIMTITEEWEGDLIANVLFGAYLQAGVDVDLGKRMILFANVKGGFGTSNPKTIAGLVDDANYEQIRVRYDMIPITFSLGILF